jgi:uncharacterized protein (TIGR03067 family)
MFAALVALSLVVPAADAKEKELTEAAKKELKKLEGKWTATEILVNGEEATPPEEQKTVEFKGKKFLLGDKELFEVASLDPSTNPKILDFKAVTDMGEIRKDNTYEAIFKLDGDTLTLALYVGEGQKRPTKFESAKDSGIVVATFKREKK